jgi:hypothetical protein
MGSAVLFVGIGIVTYIIVLGFMMNFAPVILGTVFATLDQVAADQGLSGGWLTLYNDVQSTSIYLIPMMFSLLLVLLVIKVLMIAGNRGGD